jgi:predicted alpha/beta superfamily hydrolase
MENITQEQTYSRPERSATITNPSIAGELRLHEFESRIFRNVRVLRVWVPPRYDAPENADRHYPVFYLNDGQNLFEAATSFTHIEWGVDETAYRLIGQGTVPPLIIVGIDNAQDDRLKEYLPYRSFKPPVLRPQGKRYPGFLMSEVMPFLHERYRIARGPESTGLGGSSLGALISLFTVIERPGIFGRLLLESPSLFVANRAVLRDASGSEQWPERIFLAIGTKEVGRLDKDQKAVADVRNLERSLRRAGLGNDQLLVKIDEGATHSESEWAKRFPDALQFLFGKAR